jgi:hypothetical protein
VINKPHTVGGVNRLDNRKINQIMDLQINILHPLPCANLADFGKKTVFSTLQHKPSSAMPQTSCLKTASAKSQNSAVASAPLDSQPLTRKNAKHMQETDEGEVEEPQVEKKVLLTLLYLMSSS